MTDDSVSSDIPIRIRSLNIVALALMLSGVVYAGILFVIITGEPQPDAAAGMGLPLALASAGSGMASLVMPRLLARQPVPPAPNATKELRGAVARYFSRTIIAMALAESIILFGFVLAFLGQQPLSILPFLLVGEALMLVHFPRVRRIEEDVSSAAQALLSQLIH